MIDSKASANPIRGFGAVSEDEQGVFGRRGGRAKVRDDGYEGVFWLEGRGNLIQVVEVKVKFTNLLFNPVEVSPEVASSKVIPYRQVWFDSKVGSD